MKHKYISLTLLTVMGATGSAPARAATLQSPPRLVVSIAIDQLRTDYLEAFAPLYCEGGFKKLLEGGLVCTNASYDFAPIDRASAIAAIATGTTPYYNSIVGARWLDRESLRPVYCVDDTQYGGHFTRDNTSPRHISTSTIGDELKVTSAGKAIVYAIAPFRDAAVLSAGHAADGAIWIDDANGNWCTSKYYMASTPLWIHAMNSLSSGGMARNAWTPVNSLSGTFSYFMDGGMQKPFKHTFSGPRQYIEFKTSALVNEEVTTMALQCASTNFMGVDNVTDLLSITYYAGNFDHKTLTECQMELQDTYVRLDEQLARLVSQLTQRLGADNVMFVVTSTGCSDEQTTDYAKYKIPSGTFYINRTANLLNMYFGAIWGQGKYVETCFGTQIFLNHKLLEQKRVALTEATERAQEFLGQISGVRNVYTSQQLLSSASERLAKVRNAYHPERCGDIIVEVAPGWRLINEDNYDDQMSRASFIQFPIIIYGAGTKAERITTHVTTDRIAPTIAKSIRIRAPNACSAEPLI